MKLPKQEQRIKDIARYRSTINVQGSFDLYLDRASKISQPALLIATGLMFYFTVIPLYQKDLLEESIAKKEIELLQVTTAISKLKFREDIATLSHLTIGCGYDFMDNSRDPREKFWHTDIEKCLASAFSMIDLTKYPNKVQSKVSLRFQAIIEEQKKKKEILRNTFLSKEKKWKKDDSELVALELKQKNSEASKLQESLDAFTESAGIYISPQERLPSRIIAQELNMISTFSKELNRQISDLKGQKFIDEVFENHL